MADATCGSVIGIHRYQHSSHGQLTFRADDVRGEKIPNERKTQNEVFNFITPLAELGTLGVKEEQGGQVSLPLHSSAVLGRGQHTGTICPKL